MTRTSAVAGLRRFWAFVAVALVWSWGWLAAAWLTGSPADAFPTVWFRYLSGAGPLLAAVWFVRGEGGLVRFGRRVLDVSSLTARSWAMLIGLAAGPALVTWLLIGDRRFGVEGPAAVVSVVAFALAASFAEEPGWRGYALDSLRPEFKWTVSAVLVGGVWAVWHLPLYAIEGTFQHDDVGFGTTMFWVFSLALLPTTVLMIWMMDHTRASIFTAAVFHALVNISGEVLELTDGAQVVRLLLWTAAALVVVRRERAVPTAGAGNAKAKPVIARSPGPTAEEEGQ